MSRTTPPSVAETAFSCPFCNALTTQTWYKAFAFKFDKDSRTPIIPREKYAESLGLNPIDDAETIARLNKWAGKMRARELFFEVGSRHSSDTSIQNLFLSECFNCERIAVWVHDRMVHPTAGEGPAPNPDLPADMAIDFEEARSILNKSPRGSAALLRLVIQKLCLHLGAKGKKIDDHIASFVVCGLNPVVEKSLDIVRVIGNEAVHPGQIDLNDNRDIALRLFAVVNLIVDQMITHPKNTKELYEKLPESKRNAIEDRNKKAKEKAARKSPPDVAGT